MEDILIFLRRTKELESIERYGASLRGKQNTVAAHSWRLALMALIIGPECRVRLNMGRTLSLALVHDLGEAKTGDIDAYEQMLAGKKMTVRKTAKEDEAMREMTGDIAFGKSVYDLWREYTDQRTVEARFVRALDKIEGFLHIAEGGVEMYIPKEFHASYADAAVAAFDEATRPFPELKDLLDAVKKDLKTQFEKAGVEWIDAAGSESE